MEIAQPLPKGAEGMVLEEAGQTQSFPQGGTALPQQQDTGTAGLGDTEMDTAVAAE